MEKNQITIFEKRGFRMTPAIVQYRGKLIRKKNLFVREDGKIFRQKKDGSLKMLKGCKPSQKLKYWRFSFQPGPKQKTTHDYIHRLVYTSFTQKKIPEGLEVDHINNNKNDNSLQNLQLLTHAENLKKRDEQNRDKKKKKAS